jgi:hypothetical protein
MATTKYVFTTPATWVEVAADTDPVVLVENQSRHTVLVCFSAFAPVAAAAGHTVLPGKTLGRSGVGKVYARTTVLAVTGKVPTTEVVVST